MHFRRLMHVDEMIEEANQQWNCLKEWHSALRGYRDCASFFDRVSRASRDDRERILFQLWDGRRRHEQTTNVLMILLCYRECKTVLEWKIRHLRDEEERLQTWQTMVTALLTALAEQKASLSILQNIMNNEVEKLRRRFEKEKELFFQVSFMDAFHAPIADYPVSLAESGDYREVWALIENNVREKKQLAWLRGLIVRSAHIPGFGKPEHVPRLSNHTKCKVLDTVAKVVQQKIPRLERLVKTKQAHRRRRNFCPL